MVIYRQDSPLKKDRDWFTFAVDLSLILTSDYISLKFRHHLEPLTFGRSNLVSMIEVAEKSFKVFLSLHEKFEDSLSHYRKNYGHNIEKLRARAETLNKVFGEEDIKQFSRPFDDRSGNFFQNLRYGSHSTIVGFETNLGKLMPIVDKIFFNCILNLEDHPKRNITNSSLLYFLITNSELDQSNNPSLLLKCVQMNNPYYSEYEKYCVNLKAENQRLNELFKRK